MSSNIEQIAHLERTNYVTSQKVTDHTPGLNLLMRDDVIITSSETFPSADTTHACLLRATSQTADALIEEIVDYFQAKNLPPSIYLSPACTPADLPERLQKKGFAPQEGEEAWLVFNNLTGFELPAISSDIATGKISPAEALTFAQVFLAAFEMPLDFAPYMAQLIAPAIDVPGVFHFLARLDERPIGTCSLVYDQGFGILGSVGVIPEHRGSGAASSLAIQAGHQAKQGGVDTIILQTAAGTWLERFLRISGFKKVFTRTGYTLP